tara:strand:+ start:85 stop:1062 length:978 start_codon:yes stop_codon:yes gene_type:complete
MTGYGADTTTDEVLENHDLAGRHFMITGASSGLGEESARALSQAGATVTLLARNIEKLEAAKERIQGSVPSADLRIGVVDLADLTSIRDYAENFLVKGAVIDVLINNAGIMACPFMKTTDGFEMQFGTNHIGHFLLTNLLMPAIKAGENPRIVNLSSAGHTHSDVNLEDPNFDTTEYSAWESYGRSKSANIHFTRELVRRYGEEIQSFAVHPGVILTDLGRHLTPELMEEMTERVKARSTSSTEAKETGGLPFKSMEAGAATQVWAATTNDLRADNGAYLGDCQVGIEGGNPSENGYLPYIYDEDTAKALWALSEKLVKQEFPAS